jgi:protein phosphatase
MAVEAFDDSGADGSPEELLRGVAREANRRIFEMAQSDSEHAGMGTTLTAAIVTDREVAVGHVGDSRLYRLRGERLERLTEDHSLVEELVRQGRLTPEEAETHPQRSIITRALGPEADVDVETFTHRGRDGDIYMICSDGLSGMVPDEEMTAILRESLSLKEAAYRLVDAANQNGGKDNITVVLFRLESDGQDEDEEDEEVASDTLAGQEAGGLTADQVRAAAAAEGATTALSPEEAEAARQRAQEPQSSAVRIRPPSEGGPPAPARRRRPRLRMRSRRVIGALLALLALGAAVVGLYVGSRQFYFLGTDDRGVIALYRGLPYDLPLGIHLYTKEYSSDVPASTIGDRRQRKNLLDHKLRSHGDAVTRLRQLERAETPR